MKKALEANLQGPNRFGNEPHTSTRMCICRPVCERELHMLPRADLEPISRSDREAEIHINVGKFFF